MTPEQQQTLEEGLHTFYGHPARITSVKGLPFDSYSTHPIEQLLVTLESGEQLQVIFKRILPELEDLTRDRREVLVYQKLLAQPHGSRFGAPALYTSLYDSAHDRYWLFLEDLGDATLDWGDTEDWYSAVRWMASMHAAYLDREDELRALQCLDEHNPGYYRAIAEAARQSLNMAGACCALQRLDGLLAHHDFETLANQLVSQPRTLVHGDAFPGNLGLQDGSVIRPLDWGAAAIGPAVWDLARLLDGWGGAKPRFIAAYFDELSWLTTTPFDEEARQASIYTLNHHCRIMNALLALSLQVGAKIEVEEAEADAAEVLDKIEATWRIMEGDAHG